MRMDIVDSRATDLAVGIIASIVAGISLAILEKLGIESNIATASVLIPVVTGCLIIRKESFHITRTTTALGFMGVATGAVYYIIFYVYKHVNVLVGGFGGSFYFGIFFLNIAIVIPIFEEMVVRRLMFIGLTKYINVLLAAFIVSGLFGIAHHGSMMWAFIFSLCMCALTRLGTRVIDRTAIHGAFNATLVLLLFLSPF